jgi:hypothetical protein
MKLAVWSCLTIKVYCRMFGRISRFFFSIPQEQNRLKYSPVAKILSRILIRQTLHFSSVSRLARSISRSSRRTDDGHRRIELNDASIESSGVGSQNRVSRLFFRSTDQQSYGPVYLAAVEGFISALSENCPCSADNGYSPERSRITDTTPREEAQISVLVARKRCITS